MTEKNRNQKSSKSAVHKGSKRSTGNKSLQTSRRIDKSIHIKLKHVLGGISLLSLLASFEVFSIPAANGIIDLFSLSKGMAGFTWLFVASLSGGIAISLDAEEKNI